MLQPRFGQSTVARITNVTPPHAVVPLSVRFVGDARPPVVPSRFPPPITQQALALKRAHPAWGPDRILTDLGRDPALRGLPLRSRARLACVVHDHLPRLGRGPAAPSAHASGTAPAHGRA